MDLAIIIVNWNGRSLLADCLTSIQATAGELAVQTYVVDNGSTDGSQQMVRQSFPAVTLIDAPHNPGFGGGNNLALRHVLAQPDAPHYLLLLNPDTVLHPGALQALIQFMEALPLVGVAGARLLNADGSFQFSHAPFPGLYDEWMILSGRGRASEGPWYPSYAPIENDGTDRADYVMGAVMLARTEAVRQVGLLDEGFFMYSEEVDWCYRFRKAGWAVGYVPQAVVTHIGGGSTRQVRPQMQAELYRSRVRFFRKHYGIAAATRLQALLLLIHGAKLARATVRRNAAGTPPLPWPLMRHALGERPRLT